MNKGKKHLTIGGLNMVDFNLLNSPSIGFHYYF